jgi:hypothetical protein
MLMMLMLEEAMIKQDVRYFHVAVVGSRRRSST